MVKHNVIINAAYYTSIMLHFQPSKMKLVLVTSSSFLASAGLLWNNLIKSDKHLDISWL